MPHQTHAPLLGIALKVAGVACFTIMLALARSYNDYPLTVVIFYRSFFALGVLVIWLAWRGAFPRALYTSRLPAHLVRAIAGIGSMFFTFAAFRLIPLADATALGYVQPLLVVLLAAIVLREKLTSLRVISVISGFAGILIMVWEHLGANAPLADNRALGTFCAVFGALLIAVAFIQVRRLTQTEDTGAIAFYFQGTTTLVSLAGLALAVLWPSDAPFAATIQSQAWVWPRGFDWFPLISIGVLGGCGQLLITQGFRYADASILAVFDYTSLVWAVLIGLVVFSEIPSVYVITGAGVVITAGLLVVLEENRLLRSRQDKKQPD